MEISLNPLDQIEPLVILATIAVFMATFLTLKRVFVLPFVDVMERRREMYEAADALSQQIAQVQQSGEEEAVSQVIEAREAAEALMKEAGEAAESYRRDVVGAATAQASSRLDEGRREIAQARSESLSKLREEALECVGLACERLLGDKDADAVAAVVDGQMSRRVH